MKTVLFDKALLTFHNAVLVIFAVFLLLQVFNSLDWRMEHDTPLLHYAAFLIDKSDLVPYRDIFETSMPGTIAFHYLVGKLFGYGDVAFRLVDLALLGALLAGTYLFMSRFGRLPALWAVVLFGHVYLSRGQGMSLQRDYIGVIPVAFALLCIPVKTDKVVHLSRFALVGVLFSLSVLIKPHLGIALPVVFGTLLAFRWNFQKKSALDLLKCGAVCAVSFLIPIIAAVVWLAANSALTPFLDIFFNYLPLHSAMTGWHENITKSHQVFYLIEATFRFGGYGALFLCSLFAYYRASTYIGRNKATFMSLVCLFLCTVLYAVYPTIAGKFWNYHYMPFAYFCAISAALCLYSWPKRLNSSSIVRFQEALPLVILLVALTIVLQLPRYVRSSLYHLQRGPEVHAPKGGRVDEIADWLKSRLQPGDTVQPLDWAGGSIHAMLLAEAKLATRFMYDYHFYHHISSPFIQGLRKSFISQLRKAPPRFIIAVLASKPHVSPWVSGIDSTREFPELRQFLADYYTVAFEGDGYLIYERMTDTQPKNAQQVAPADADKQRR